MSLAADVSHRSRTRSLRVERVGALLLAGVIAVGLAPAAPAAAVPPGAGPAAQVVPPTTPAPAPTTTPTSTTLTSPTTTAPATPPTTPTPPPTTVPATPPPPVVATAGPLDTWAWCGVHPDDPTAAAAAASMATAAGIDVTFGPCNVPTGDYSPAFTADRYVAPELYRRLVEINAAAGMRTVVYDARLWSSSPAVRAEAVRYWAPLANHIAAWDLGDEFDPDGPQWSILVQRWNLLRDEITPVTGVSPFTNHLYWATDEAVRDLPGADELLSFTWYADDKGAAVARQMNARTRTLMCGVNAFDHLSYTPTIDTIRADMNVLRAAGCDQFLVFGGQRVYGTALFGGDSLVDGRGGATPWSTAVREGSGRSSFTGVTPARLLETRVGAGFVTVDGRQAGVGRRGDGALSGIEVAGRAGVPARVAAVSLNITAVSPSRPGFVTVFPCGRAQPRAAQLNHGRVTVSTTVVVRPGDDGRVCVYNMADTDLVVDVDGYLPEGAAFVAGDPVRLLETRAGEGLGTIDGRDAGIGPREGGSVTELQVTGRAGVPSAVNAVVLSVTATETRAPGFVTVFPCGGPIPTSANLNFTASSTVTNAVVVGVGAGGRVCLYTMATTDLVVDLGGYLPVPAPVSTAPPTRMLDTRSGPGLSTIDGLQFAIGARSADTVTALPIAGRGGVPVGATAVVLGVTVTEPRRAGFVTVMPCGAARPNAASLNFVTGQTVSNMVVADLADDGTVCLYTMAGTHLVVDVLSHLP